MTATYTIRINELQRALLQRACAGYRSLADSLTTEQREELELLSVMLDDMPGIEAEDPGVLHGLCL